MSKNLKLPSQPLDFKTFSALLAKNHKGAETSDEAYGALFRSINKDGSGNVSSAELRTALQHFGNNSLSEVKLFFLFGALLAFCHQIGTIFTKTHSLSFFFFLFFFIFFLFGYRLRSMRLFMRPMSLGMDVLPSKSS